jgi:parallel beta-helix repeat protein
MIRKTLFVTTLLFLNICIVHAVSTIVNASTFGLNTANTDLVNGVAVASMATYAASHPNTKIIINTGEYKIKRNAAQIIDFNYCNNVEIDGKGATFVLSETDKKYNGSFFQLDHCQNMTIRNLIIDWDWDIMPLNAIGKITAVTKTGQTGATYEIVNNVNTTARPKNTLSSRAWSNTLKCRSSVGGFALAADTAIWIDSKHVFVGIASTTSLNAAKVGYYTMLAFETNFTGSAIVADYCTSLTIDNVSVYSIPGPSFSISGSTNYSVTNCNIIPKPGSDRYTSTTSGGEYHNSSGSVLIENNKMIYTTDDGIHMSDNYIPPHMKNDPVNPKVVIADTLQFYTTSYVLNVGDTLDFRYPDFSPTGVFAVLVATKWDMNYFLNKSSNLGDHRCTLTFDRDIPAIPAGAFLFNRRYGRENVRIANNIFAYNFCHGLCYCVPNGVIENNCISRTAYSGIRSYLTFRSKKWVMGTGPSNVIIRNNTLYECNNGVDQVAPASLYVGAGIDGGGYNYTISTNRTALTNVSVTGNTVYGSDSHGIYVTSITGATVDNNTMIDVGRNPLPTTLTSRGALTVECANNVTLINNKIIQPTGTSRKGLVIVAASTSGVTSTGLQQLVQKTTLLSLPASDIQSTSFIAKWKKVPGVVSYLLNLYRKNFNQTSDSLINQFSVLDSSLVISGLSMNQNYSYTVSIQPSLCNSEIMPLSNMIYVKTANDLSTISNTEFKHIKIVPSICLKELTVIGCDSIIPYYEIICMSGLIVRNGLLTNKSIVLTDLNRGIYMIKLKMYTQIILQKFVKV